MDLSKDLQKLITNKRFFLVIIVLLGYIVGGVVLWGGVTSKLVAYQNQIQQKKQKSKVIEEYEKNKKNFDEYVSSMPKVLTPDALTKKISDYVTQNNIEIVDVSPESPKKLDFYVSTSIFLSTKSKDFKDYVAFVKMLENSPYSFRIDNWKGSMEDASTGNILCELNITSVQVKK